MTKKKKRLLSRKHKCLLNPKYLSPLKRSKIANSNNNNNKINRNKFNLKLKSRNQQIFLINNRNKPKQIKRRKTRKLKEWKLKTNN